MESSRCCSRLVGCDSPNHPGSRKWTSNSLALAFCVFGPALRTSTAKPTALTTGCALEWHCASFPGTKVNVFWRRATLASHARRGVAASATRCSPREPTFGARAPMGCGGLEKSARVRRITEYTSSDFWTTRGRSSFPFPRRATRPQQGRKRLLVPLGPRRQRVPAGDPAKRR